MSMFVVLRSLLRLMLPRNRRPRWDLAASTAVETLGIGLGGRRPGLGLSDGSELTIGETLRIDGDQVQL